MTLNLPPIMLVLCLMFLADHVQALAGPDKPSEPMERADAMDDCADRKAVRPSPKERVAVIKLLEQKPRPKTYIDADIKYLRSLMEKAVWTGAERRIVWEMWQEATGQSLDAQTAAPH